MYYVRCEGTSKKNLAGPLDQGPWPGPTFALTTAHLRPSPQTYIHLHQVICIFFSRVHTFAQAVSSPAMAWPIAVIALLTLGTTGILHPPGDLIFSQCVFISPSLPANDTLLCDPVTLSFY